MPGGQQSQVDQMAKKVAPSRHMVWYREIVPATVPVIILGTGIFFTLTIIQTHLSHSRSLQDSSARITALEEELADLRSSQQRQAVNWSAGLGRVVRRVRDLGREVEHVVDSAHVVEEPSLQHTAEGLKAKTSAALGSAGKKLTPLARATGEKMDSLRHETTHHAERVSTDVAERMDSVPGRADPRTADASLAQRLIAAFGNPFADGGRAKEELRKVQQSAVGVADQAARELGNVKENLQHLDIAQVKDALVRAEEKIEAVVTPLASATGKKMDNLRHGTEDLAERISTDVSERLDSLPERADPRTAEDASLAQRLIETFGNPFNDGRRAKEELEQVRQSAAGVAEQATREFEHQKETLRQLDMAQVKDALARAEEKIEAVVIPLATTTGQKMDSLRHETEEFAERISTDVSQRLDALPRRADPRTAEDASVARRLITTFGNPFNDGRRTKEELEQVRQSAAGVADQAAREFEHQKETLRQLDMAQVKDALNRAEEKIEAVVTPLASATAQKMDNFRETATERASTLTHDLQHTVSTTSQSIQDRVDALPPTGVDGPEQGVDPVLASRLVATFGNAADDSRATRREFVEVAGEDVVGRAERGVQEVKAAAGKVENAVEGVVEAEREKASGSRWWARW